MLEYGPKGKGKVFKRKKTRKRKIFTRFSPQALNPTMFPFKLDQPSFFPLMSELFLRKKGGEKLKYDFIYIY